MNPKLKLSIQLSREEVNDKLSLGRDERMSEQAASVINLDFQQAINCCGFTSVAYALSAVGCPTSVDDIFQSVGVNVESAVGDGMTLAEMYEASLRYVSLAKLPIFVECYHFDEAKATLEKFRKACQADADAGIDDLLILNFHSGIAHGWEKGGGGHFSVLTAHEDEDDNVIMADVHGIKYGSFWSTPLEQIFDAMQDRDSCGRSRGALRFGRTDKEGLERPLPGMEPTLLDWCAPPAAYSADHLQKYIPTRWDENLGVKNMEGVSALSSAIRVLDGDDVEIGRLDGIMRKLKESYVWHLNNFVTSDKILEMANKLEGEGFTTAKARVEPLGTTVSATSLREALKNSKCGEPGVVVMVCYDFNDAYGAPMMKKEKGEAGALSHGVRTWSLIAGMDLSCADEDTNGLVVAPAHNVIMAGRLWTTSMANMAKAIQTIGGGDNCELIILTSPNES